MLDLRFTNSFRQDFKKIKKRGYDLKLLYDVVEKLQNEVTLEPRFQDHILKGKKYSGLHECHILPDWLLVYRIIDNELILELLYTGTHSDLFH